MDYNKEKYKKIVNAKLKEKPFGVGMYAFVMFLINHYSRIRKELRLDYDSFMIIQVVVSHSLYNINKETFGKRFSFDDLGYGWNEIIKKNQERTPLENLENGKGLKKNNKLTISSICLLTNLPKETVRRKTGELCKGKILNCSLKKGVTVGENYKNIFEDFVPETTYEVVKLMKTWQKSGVLKSLLDFKF
jgi:hypothetical protein